jgi:hypothetical protein
MKIEEVKYSSWAEFKTRIISDQFSEGKFQRGALLISWPRW